MNTSGILISLLIMLTFFGCGESTDGKFGDAKADPNDEALKDNFFRMSQLTYPFLCNRSSFRPVIQGGFTSRTYE